MAFKEAVRPMIPTLEWTIHTEGESVEFYNDQIRKHVIGEGRTAFVTGPPGSGKSEVLRGIAEELRAQDETVKIISLTHVAAGNVEGQTAHSFIHRFVQYGQYKGWLLIDVCKHASSGIKPKVILGPFGLGYGCGGGPKVGWLKTLDRVWRLKTLWPYVLWQSGPGAHTLGVPPRIHHERPVRARYRG